MFFQLFIPYDLNSELSNFLKEYNDTNEWAERACKEEHIQNKK